MFENIWFFGKHMMILYFDLDFVTARPPYSNPGFTRRYAARGHSHMKETQEKSVNMLKYGK
jgi:hypothetical protein